jgi:hypothetical protein
LFATQFISGKVELVLIDLMMIYLVLIDLKLIDRVLIEVLAQLETSSCMPHTAR